MVQNRTNIHVIFDKDKDHWKVIKQGGKRPLRTFQRQDQAERFGRRQAKASRNRPSELFIHQRSNGQIRKRITYGQDPYPPEG